MQSSVHHILILAAGASRRLGRPKQLVDFNDSNLLNHVIREAIDSDFDDTLLVLGSESEKILRSVIPVDHVVNDNWSEGMGSSIATGVKILSEMGSQGVLICVCDQPYVSRDLFNEILNIASESEKGIVTSNYGVGSGPPTYFDKKYFASLVKCEGDKGAKRILEENASDIRYVSFNKGRIDIDTPSDIKKLKT